MNKVGRSEVFHKELLQYWETCDDHQGGIIGSVSEKAICIRSYANMNCGTELKIKLFFSLGYDFTQFQVSAKVIEKDIYCQEGWELYEYQLEFISLSKEDGLKLRNLLRIQQDRTSTVDDLPLDIGESTSSVQRKIEETRSGTA